jgi:mannitol/fructose-specific phosphotransferase system IIA component (Ntr-type)
VNLRELLRPQLTDVNLKVNDWQDAIRAAGRLLVEDQAAEPRFIEAMIQVAKDLGPYIVVAPGIALPHARPEDGVLKASMAMITLEPPIDFGNERNDPVYIVVALAAKDNEQHVEGLAEMAKVLGQPNLVEDLKHAQSRDELLSIMLSEPAADNGT